LYLINKIKVAKKQQKKSIKSTFIYTLDNLQAFSSNIKVLITLIPL
jgi:hypothetical protein